MEKRSSSVLQSLTEKLSRPSDEGNRPDYIASALKRDGYIGERVEIMGWYMLAPQTTVMKRLDDVSVEEIVTTIGTVKALRLAGEIEWSEYNMPKGTNGLCRTLGIGTIAIASKHNPYARYFTKVESARTADASGIVVKSRAFFTDGIIPEYAYVDS